MNVIIIKIFVLAPPPTPSSLEGVVSQPFLALRPTEVSQAEICHIDYLRDLGII